MLSFRKIESVGNYGNKALCAGVFCVRYVQVTKRLVLFWLQELFFNKLNNLLNRLPWYFVYEIRL